MDELPDVDRFPLVQVLEAAWAAGVCTWEARAWRVHWWMWFTLLCQVTNARSNGWDVPSPWAQ